MSLRNRVAVLLLLLTASLPFAAIAQTTAPAAAPAAAPAVTGATVHGMVVDPDDALIPGATVTLVAASGKTQTTTSKSDGTYTFRGVAAGAYTVTAVAPGFANFSNAVTVTTGANVSSDVKMTLMDTTQTVTVSTDTVQLSVDPENNASATVITGDALNALSDDPDELSAELSALAGPSAGPNGGQIYIDGFTGGQLPPKPPSWRSASTRTRSPRNTMRRDMGALRSSPNRGRTSSTVAAASSSRTRYSTHRRRFWARRTFSRTITRTLSSAI